MSNTYFAAEVGAADYFVNDYDMFYTEGRYPQGSFSASNFPTNGVYVTDVSTGMDTKNNPPTYISTASGDASNAKSSPSLLKRVIHTVSDYMTTSRLSIKLRATCSAIYAGVKALPYANAQLLPANVSTEASTPPLSKRLVKALSEPMMAARDRYDEVLLESPARDQWHTPLSKAELFNPDQIKDPEWVEFFGQGDYDY